MSGLVADILAGIDERPADEVRLGVRYSGVRVGDRIGVAFTMAGDCDPPRDAGSLRGRKLCGLAGSANLMEATLGAAAVNAHLEPSGHELVNVFDRILAMAPRFKRVGMVGRFPIADELRRLCEEVHVFELRQLPGCLPASAAEELLPKCDLAIITGTTFVNGTLERLLELSAGHTMVIGPTTPLSRVLFERGADAIAGIVATDPIVLDIVSEGGGTPEFMPFVEPVYIEAKK